MSRSSTSFPALLLGLFFFCYFVSGLYYFFVFSEPIRPFPDESVVVLTKEISATPLPVLRTETKPQTQKQIAVYVPPAQPVSVPEPNIAYPYFIPAPLPSPEPAGTAPNGNITYSTSTIYYDIYGLTENELRAEMDAKGPASSNKEKYDAYTSRYYEWNYFTAWDGKNCYPDEVRVTVGIKMTLPRWVWYASAQESLKTKWTNYINILTFHESGHVEINARGAQDLYQRLINAGPYPDCKQLDTTLHQVAQTFYNDIKIENEAYDANTNHGVSQGAVFP